MEVLEALKALAPAVGDGKLVPQHAYVYFDGPSLRACNGFLWAGATVDARYPIYVRHASLLAAMDRDGAEMLTGEGTGVWVRAGRSRLKLKGTDLAAFPLEPEGHMARWTVNAPPDFRETLEVMAGFTGKPDNHIWQMGVHFMEDMVFAASPFALVVRAGYWFPNPITFPPWATKFILSQESAPNMVADADRHLKVLWGGRLHLTSALLIEQPSEASVSMAARMATTPFEGQPVPDNLKTAVERVKALGATRVKIGAGKIEHTSDELEFEEEVDIQGPVRTWGVDTLLDALAHAEHINLSGGNDGHGPGQWQGGAYRGIFAGMSG